MELEPLFARVVLAREKPEKVGNIFVPQQYAKRNSEPIGRVIAVGATCDEAVKKLLGKLVLIGKFAGDWIKLPDGREVYVCQDEDLLGVING